MWRTAFILLFVSSTCAAQSFSAQTSAQQLSLLELYTSEGCSSCPPADVWLSRLRDHPGLWKSLVPIAFHVDYWNDLGWPDRFAQARFSDRQRRYARSGYSRSVYTPGFFINGAEWREWFRDPQLPMSPGKAVGILTVQWDGARLHARYAPQDASGSAQYQLQVTALGIGLQTKVQQGENQGKTLRHDFVVLAWDTFAATDSAAGAFQWQVAYNPQFEEMVEKKALAVWVTREGDPKPLQALGGWIEP